MNDFFAAFYEWFGLIPLYSKDFGDHLRGWDITCTDYIGSPLYTYIGTITVITVVLFYALQYHIIDSSKFKSKIHWWLIALLICIISFLVAFSLPFNDIQSGDYCNQLNISTIDCVGFGISNAVWSILFFALISTIPYPRRLSINCRHTNFWRP